MNEDLAVTISELMNYPATDDPIDVLKSIAAVLGDSNYSYFDNRGTWVYHGDES